MARESYSLRTCVHYRDTRATCRADIDPASVTDDDGRLPCVTIRGITGKIACVKLLLAPILVIPSGTLERQLAAIVDGKCPSCGGPIEAEMEFNESILALPCRHVIRSAKDRR